MIIRPTTAEDIGPLQRVLDETGLFPSEVLPDLLQGFLTGDADALWFTAELDNQATGFCFAAPEPYTNGNWNMRAIAVLPAHHGRRLGGSLVLALERALQARGQRILVVDTSGSADFAPARSFYRGLGYTEVARIPEFWDRGDDKIVFWKALSR